MTKRVRIGVEEKLELEVVGEDGRTYVLHGAWVTHLELRLDEPIRASMFFRGGGGSLEARFVFDRAEVVADEDQPDLGRVDSPPDPTASAKRDARGRKRPPESYGDPQAYSRTPPRSSGNPFDPFAQSDFRRRGRDDGWPSDMADDENAANARADRENEEARRRAAEKEERAREARRNETAEEREERRRRAQRSVEDFFTSAFGGRGFGGFGGFGFGFDPPRSPPAAGWRKVLENPQDRAAAEAAYRRLAKARHPDMPGGSHEAMVELNQAIEEARAHFGRR